MPSAQPLQLAAPELIRRRQPVEPRQYGRTRGRDAATVSKYGVGELRSDAWINNGAVANAAAPSHQRHQ